MDVSSDVLGNVQSCPESVLYIPAECMVWVPKPPSFQLQVPNNRLILFQPFGIKLAISSFTEVPEVQNQMNPTVVVSDHFTVLDLTEHDVSSLLIASQALNPLRFLELIYSDHFVLLNL
jgi:hypothetical protein